MPLTYLATGLIALQEGANSYVREKQSTNTTQSFMSRPYYSREETRMRDIDETIRAIDHLRGLVIGAADLALAGGLGLITNLAVHNGNAPLAADSAEAAALMGGVGLVHVVDGFIGQAKGITELVGAVRHGYLKQALTGTY